MFFPKSDALDYILGAVLSHRMAARMERPIGYASRLQNTAERGYSTIEKEALATFFGVKKYKVLVWAEVHHTDRSQTAGGTA